MNQQTQLKRWQADIILILVALVWGVSFPMIKDSLEDVEPFFFIVLRFYWANLVFLIILRQKIFRIPASIWKDGLISGTFLFSGYAFQTFGIQMSSASHAAIITGLYCPFVPIISFLWLREKQHPKVLLGIGIATLGTWMLVSHGNSEGGPDMVLGDLLTFFCAIGFAAHIVSISKSDSKSDPAAFTFVQMLTVGFFANVAWLLFEPSQSFSSIGKNVWLASAFTGVIATAFAYLIQVHFQKFTTSARTALAFSTEPAWGAFFAAILVGETLTKLGYFGGCLVILSILIVELPSATLLIQQFKQFWNTRTKQLKQE